MNDLIEAQELSSFKVKLFLFCILSFSYFLFVSDYLMLTSLGLSFSLYIALDFINQLGKSFLLRKIMVLLACMQWIIGAKVSYEYGKIHYKYYMYVNEEEYMTLVVPAVIAFYFGLYFIKLPNLKSKLDDALKNNLLKNPVLKETARVILALGIIGAVLPKLVSIPLVGFVFFLMGLLLYVAAGYYFYLYPRYRMLILLSLLGLTFIQAVFSGLFHNFLLTSIFLFAIYIKVEVGFFKKVVALAMALIVINVIQTVKHEYRNEIWEGKATNQIEVFVNLIEKKYFQGEFSWDTFFTAENSQESGGVKGVATRMNQGWIISKVMNYVPRNQDYLKGETINDALSASLLPRFLFPEKASGLDSKETFEKVTGLELIKGTSMGLSLVGEFYVNYGILGAWIGLFIYGLFISLSIRFLMVYSKFSPFIILWFVLVYFQVIKAETYLLKVLNHLIKAGSFLIFLHLTLKAFNFELFPIPNELAEKPEERKIGSQKKRSQETSPIVS